MTRTSLPLVALFLVPVMLARCAAADPAVKAIEEQMQRTIADVSPCVVAVVVSHSKKYPDQDQKKKPGELGGYEAVEPLNNDGFRRPWRIQLPQIDPLDLSLAENVANHQFGSGVVLDVKAGLVLVPYHLTDGATKVYVRASNGKGSYADLVAADAKSDLAVLRLIAPTGGLKAVTFADVRLVATPDGKKPTVARGSFVLAVGHPLGPAVGDGGASASWGIVTRLGSRSAVPPTATDANQQKPFHTYESLIQLDARVSLGSTGAGVFDMDGKLIGLGSAVAAVSGSDATGGYAIPMDASHRRIVGALQRGREVEYGFLGIVPDRHHESGVVVRDVSPGCPAALAGLVGGDVLTAVDGHPLRSPDDVHLHVGAAQAGTDVTIEYRPQDRLPVKTVTLKLAKNQNQLPYLATDVPPATFGLRVDYQSIKMPGLLQRRGGGFGRVQIPPPSNPPEGVVIRDKEPNSPADRKFAALGEPKSPQSWWVITHVDGKRVRTPDEFRTAAAGNRTTIRLTVADADDPASIQEVILP
jgi:serine protease Do